MAFELKNVSVTLSHQEILKDVSLSISEGKRTAIIGPNGAGKSTLLRTMAGMQKNSAGEVYFEGKRIADFSRKELAKRLAMLPQGMAAPTDVTVEQLVDYGRFPYRSWYSVGNPVEDRQAVEEAIAQTNLSVFRKRQVMSLSGGERQRAWIAMALAQQPKTLLLDEPTTYLDIAHQLEVMQIVERLNQGRNMTVVMVLHDINHALQFADEIVIIKNRSIYAKGVPKDVLTVEMLAEVFGVRADIFCNSQGISVFSPLDLVK